jgi:hypothetical protein
MDPEEARIEHLKLIQAVIGRMARNSFAMRTVSGSLVAALTALIVSYESPLIGTGGVSLFMFWVLDAYYLRQERLFRQLYDAVRQGTPADFGGMNYFTMNTRTVASKVPGPLGTVFTGILIAFYTSLATVVVVAALLSQFT